MENVKKTLVVFGAVAVAMLMVSVATAVPQVQSKPVMDQIQQKELLSNKLINIYNRLNADGKLAVESQRNTNLDLITDLDRLFDEEGFLNHIVSDEFIQFLNDNYNTIISDSLFQGFYNSEPVQQFIHNEGFIAFMNSDEVQYMLDHFNPSNQNVASSQESIVNSQVASSAGTQQQSSVGGMGTTASGTTQGAAATMGNTVAGSTTPSVNAQPGDGWFPGQIILLVFAYLLFGVITWIPALIYGIIYTPFAYLSVMYDLLAQGAPPIITLSLGLIVVIIEFIFYFGFWPITWGLYLFG